MMHIMNIMNIMISGYESLYTHLHGSDIFSSWKVWSQFRSRPGLQICRCLASDLEGRDFVEIYHSWGIPPPFDWVYFSESILSTFTVICDEDVFRVAGTQWLQCGLCCAQLRRFGEDWSTFERFFFLAGSFCVMEWGKQFCFLFATLLCEFVLLFRAFLYLFHGGWFVEFDFSVFFYINQLRTCGWCEGFSSWVEDRNSHDTVDARNPAGPGTSQTL